MPGSHAMQSRGLVLFLSLLYVPIGHAVGPVELVGQYEPIGHSKAVKSVVPA
jgi:hypothetical protein